MMKTFRDTPPIGMSFPLAARPAIKWKHIDGPLLIFRDGQLHWLSLWERFLVTFGFENAESLERKHRPSLMKVVELQEIEPAKELDDGFQ